MEGQIYLGDCLEVAEQIEPNSVDLILCDPPYGMMQKDTRPESRPITWDYMIPPEKLLDISARVLRRNGTAIFFSQGIFTAQMRMAYNRFLTFTQGGAWIKNKCGNPFICKRALTSHFEDLSIYRKLYDLKHNAAREYSKKMFEFMGVKTKREVHRALGHYGAMKIMEHDTANHNICTEKTYRQLIDIYHIDQMDGFLPYEELKELFASSFGGRVFNILPGRKQNKNIFEYTKDVPPLHPTQKPVGLLEELIRIYTNEGDTVLDWTMGVGSTCVAAVNTRRNYIGIEMNEEYFAIAKQRIEEAKYSLLG